jgi:hypothetical protein
LVRARYDETYRNQLIAQLSGYGFYGDGNRDLYDYENGENLTRGFYEMMLIGELREQYQPDPTNEVYTSELRDVMLSIWDGTFIPTSTPFWIYLFPASDDRAEVSIKENIKDIYHAIEENNSPLHEVVNGVAFIMMYECFVGDMEISAILENGGGGGSYCDRTGTNTRAARYGTIGAATVAGAAIGRGLGQAAGMATCGPPCAAAGGWAGSALGGAAGNVAGQMIADYMERTVAACDGVTTQGGESEAGGAWSDFGGPPMFNSDAYTFTPRLP